MLIATPLVCVKKYALLKQLLSLIAVYMTDISRIINSSI